MVRPEADKIIRLIGVRIPDLPYCSITPQMYKLPVAPPPQDFMEPLAKWTIWIKLEECTAVNIAP
jgi:hypothetical protein